MKKLLSILIVAVMLVGMLPFAFAADAAPATIALDEVKTVTAERSNPIAKFTFTAPEDGDYVFYSEGDDADTYGELYSAEGEFLSDSDDYNGSNFAIFYTLAKGETVTLKTRLYHMLNKGTFNVKVSKQTVATEIKVSRESIELYAGSYGYLYSYLAPVNAYEEDINVSVADPSIISIDEDYTEQFYALKEGSTTITLSTESGVTKTVKVTVKAPTPITLGKAVNGTSKEEYESTRYSFTPEKDGYYTFEVSSDSYCNIYVVSEGMHYSGGDGNNPTSLNYMQAGQEYTLVVNIFRENSNYSVVVREPKPATDIYIEESSGTAYVDFQDWLYVYGNDGEITDGIEWSIDNAEIAEIYPMPQSNHANIIYRKAGTATVTAKYGDAVATYEITVVDIPDIKVGTPYTAETIGMDELVVNFTPEKSGYYKVSATDELGVGTYVNIEGMNSNEEYCDSYLEAGTTYMLRASRFFMGIGMGFDEYDYVGDITVNVTELVDATGIEIKGGDTVTAYKGITFELTAVADSENATIIGMPEWELSDTENGEITGYYHNNADVIFYELGEYTVTATYGEYTDTVKVKVVEPEKIEYNTKKTVTIPATESVSFMFTPAATGVYTIGATADEYIELFTDENHDYGTEATISYVFEAGESYTVTVYGEAGTEVTVFARDAKLPTRVKTERETTVLEVGEYYYPSLKFTPSEIRESIKTVVSTDEKVVKPSEEGEAIVAVGEGTAVVTYITDYGLQASMTITVAGEDYAWATDLALDKYELTVTVGGSDKLTATAEAETQKIVNWVSEDESIVRVDANGRVTGISEGTTYVGAYVDGLYEVCEVTVVKPEIKDTSKVFTDVKTGKWYTNAINYAYSHNFIAGTAKDTFGRDTKVNRAMFITILARIAGVDTTTKGINKVETKFTDVKSGKYYTAAIKWASENGIVSGTSETTFSPESNISRQDLCVMVVNFAKFMDVDLEATVDEVNFTDAKDIRKYAKSAVTACQKAGIITGYTDGSFGPSKTATRAEAAQILYKFHSDFMA